MKFGSREIDHVVYCTPNLEDSIAQFEEMYGVEAVPGGRHTFKGTKNALFRLGDRCYFEMLAIDTEKPDWPTKRWMGIDFVEIPKITRICFKSLNLEKDAAVLRSYHAEHGQIEQGERQTTKGDFLRWKLAVPSASPEVDLIPFFVDWSESAVHPCDNMDKQCELLEIKMAHPNPSKVQVWFKKLGVELAVEQSEFAEIKIRIKGPNGVFDL